LDCALGGSVRGDDGHATCRAQCSASLDALRSPAQGKTMRLPTMPHPERGQR
jgi:hypothetical protein